MKYFSLNTLFFISSLLAFSFSASVPAITLYKWVDAEGNISYQDQPPTSGQKYEEKSFSSEGARTGDTNAEFARSRAIQDNPVILYIADNCDSCDLVSKILESNNVPYEKIPVDNDPKAQNDLIDLIGTLRVPILAIGEEIIEGSSRATIEDALRKKGYAPLKAEAVPQ